MGRAKNLMLAAGASLLSIAILSPAPAFDSESFALVDGTKLTETVERPYAGAAYWNATLPVEQRVADLLARMTLEEKIAQIITIWNDKPKVQDDGNFFDGEKASSLYPDGLGLFARPSDLKGPGSPRINKPRSIEESIRYVNALQIWARTQTRLGIPVLTHEESLHGLAALNATSFPQSIGLASTWDPDLVRDVNDYIASEVRARGVHQVLSPVVDVARDPRWGRIEETFGEDPYLVGEMGVAAVEGLQGVGKNPKLGQGQVLATLKHMTGHGQPESGTNIGPAQISERTLREMFFPPFKEVVDRTAIQAVMASYNEIDGIPSHSNNWLLNGVLRGEWGYQGAVVSDYYAIEEMVTNHRIAKDIPEAARIALGAGVDVDLPSGIAFSTLGDQVKDGKVSMTAIDQAVTRLLTMKFNAGLFEDPFVDDMAPALRSNTQQGKSLALKAAEKSVILLKNEGALPLALPAKNATTKKPTIAVIGPNANVARLGGYYGIPRDTVTPLEGITQYVGNKANLVYAKGVTITKNDDWWADEVELGDVDDNKRLIAEAVEAARGADTILLFIGDTEQSSREGWAVGHLGDRTSLDLVAQQNDLFAELKKLGKPIISVLINGRPPSYAQISEQSDAILETWYAGEQQGNAIANILFGKVNPGGKLPVTVARNVGQLPVFYNHKTSARRGYLFSDKSPLYPFGFGLSYTQFALGKPILSSTTIAAGSNVTVSVPVTNKGDRAGDETVQIYLRDDTSSVTRPVKELAGFKRVTLQPGETKMVDIVIKSDRFAFWNRDMKRVIEPGTFTIMIGPNSAELQSVKLTITE